ncbi:MAG: phosphoribosylanthranilate isomerase [Bryobacteraceae bacterium]
MLMIKICGITRREDALAAAEAGASAIGFVFYPHSPRYVTPEKAAEMGDGIAIEKVGVFVDETPATIETAMKSANLDIAQIYGDNLPVHGRIWRAVRVAAGRALEIDRQAEAILLDGAANGLSFDWRIARGAAKKVIVAGGLDASNVGDAIRAAEPWGVDASSRLESSPGIKDHEKMRRFIRAAQECA